MKKPGSSHQQTINNTGGTTKSYYEVTNINRYLTDYASDGLLEGLGLNHMYDDGHEELKSILDDF